MGGRLILELMRSASHLPRPQLQELRPVTCCPLTNIKAKLSDKWTMTFDKEHQITVLVSYIAFKDKLDKSCSDTHNCFVTRQEAEAGNQGSSPHTGTDHRWGLQQPSCPRRPCGQAQR